MTRPEGATVRISDLEKELGLSGKAIRQILRKAGLKPKTGTRYEWTEGSEELTLARSLLWRRKREARIANFRRQTRNYVLYD